MSAGPCGPPNETMRTESKRKIEVYNVSAMSAAGRRTFVIQGPSTSIRGFFAENQGLFIGQGVAYFRNYPGCGTAQTGWSVTRR